MTSYADYLASKSRAHEASGFAPKHAIHPVLFPFQGELTARALKLGRSAIFADCGLGKTIMQLEWARHICDKTGGSVSDPGTASRGRANVPRGEERGWARVVVRITRYSTRVLDFDNGAGGCKPLGDQLRAAGLIRDDSPEEIDFQFKQAKVKTRKECGTLIEIL